MCLFALGETNLNGEGGIRTLDRVAPIQHFQCCALNRSATSPNFIFDNYNLAGRPYFFLIL